jgi:hypothetical protein
MGLAVVNIFVTMRRWRAMHFLLGMLLIVFLMASVTMNGKLFRKIRKVQNASDLGVSCGDSQRGISETDLNQTGWSNWCKQKYLPEATKCRKADLAFYWELYEKNKTSKTRSLDPACCKQSTSFMLFPMWVLGWCTLALSLWTLAMIGGNLYLSQEQGVIVQQQRMGCLGVLMIFLALLAIGLAIGGSFIKLGGPSFNPSLVSYNNLLDGAKQDPDFQLVPRIMLKNSEEGSSVCYKWNIKTMPKAVIDSALFTGDNAGFRIAIFAKNSTINTTDRAGAINGSLRTRNVFYAGQLNSNDAYVLFKGTESQVNQYLANTKVCPIDLTQKEEVYVNTEQLDLSLLNSQGLKNSESTSGYAEPTPNGSSATISGHPDWVSGPKGNWKSKFSLNANLSTAKIIGRLQTKTTAGVLIDYTAPYITIQCYDRGNNAITVTKSGAVFQAPVRIFPAANYTARCTFTDTSVADSGNSALNTQYLYNEIGVNVPGKSVTKEVNFGNILLLTRNGQYCADNTGNCWTDQKFKSGPVNVSVVNGITGLLVSGVSVKLQKYYYPETDTVSSAATKNG